MNSHKYSIGNIVNNIVIIVYGQGVLDLPGGSLHKLYTCATTMLYT